MTSKNSKEIAELCVNTIKVLAVEGVQKANSGHPGAPMGIADMAFVLWSRHLRFNPVDPEWINRDRFVLSAGHASMLLYSLIHLHGYDLPIEELKNFRQMGSRTPGHPEKGMTPGVEMTSGPLGQGISTAVGMAVAGKMAAARFNRNGHEIINHRVFGICSDGDLMEGVAAEATSLAGHLGLGNLIFLYDDNKITIEGDTSIAFTEDVSAIFRARGWHVQEIDGHHHEQIDKAIENAIAETGKPSLIRARTTIAKGAPSLEGSHKTHGSPLGDQEISNFKKSIGWPSQESFHVPAEAARHFAECVELKKANYTQWQSKFQDYCAKEPELGELFKTHQHKVLPADLEKIALDAVSAVTKDATRSISGMVINALASNIPWLVGGSADLAPSNNTYIKGGHDIGDQNAPDGPFAGKNFHFGIREHGMSAVMNGISLHGMFKPFGGTFLVFSDYSRPAIRLSCIMNTDPVYVFTHDSIFLGEDGPTHQPVEHLSALRAIPNMTLFRPADQLETAMAWVWAMENAKPSLLALTRQKIPALPHVEGFTPRDILKGGYVVKMEKSPERLTSDGVVILATGSEVETALNAADLLQSKGIDSRVVSIPSLELFDRMGKDYRNSIIPEGSRVAAVEAASPMCWYKYTGVDGLVISMESFGESAPAEELADHFGFTPEKVAHRISSWLKG
ncbi:MAG: transketolase [Candidatus Wallbacteria bacterium HGW-Wallbacteria-1]|jgi:transketolase|uniref:Transketolase n=1 Tax=Candidatus Wallbacteria bacterium HGW-Wallbacteria-1 TaxID=2013854 RepID=A0A2N1PRL0_9BACT|nr:MAG: transketolase [Candidatus Wallbacteria bacterium HGW-Wallbacteria-1]